MNIANSPRILFTTLRAQMQETNSSDLGLQGYEEANTYTARFGDQVSVTATKDIPVTLPKPFTLNGAESPNLVIQARSTVDNNSDTNDSIYLRTDKGRFRVSEFRAEPDKSFYADNHLNYAIEHYGRNGWRESPRGIFV